MAVKNHRYKDNNPGEGVRRKNEEQSSQGLYWGPLALRMVKEKRVLKTLTQFRVYSMPTASESIFLQDPKMIHIKS